MDHTILTGKQVAAIFGVHPQTVITWAEQGRIAHWRTPGGHRRYALADVERLKADLTPPSTASSPTPSAPAVA
jgi:excisionase family DNA binding protein